MTARDLPIAFVAHWPEIERDLLERRYQPQPVRMASLYGPQTIKDGRKLLERIEHFLGLVRHQLIPILAVTSHESRQRSVFLRQYPYEWLAPCSNRPSMPPSVDGPRDRFGAIVQPDNKNGKAPYGWFGR